MNTACLCEDFESHSNLVNGFPVLPCQFGVKPFVFCPWCGGKLEIFPAWPLAEEPEGGWPKPAKPIQDDSEKWKDESDSQGPTTAT